MFKKSLSLIIDVHKSLLFFHGSNSEEHATPTRCNVCSNKYHYVAVLMFTTCINSFKALFYYPNWYTQL